MIVVSFPLTIVLTQVLLEPVVIIMAQGQLATTAQICRHVVQWIRDRLHVARPVAPLDLTIVARVQLFIKKVVQQDSMCLTLEIQRYQQIFKLLPLMLQHGITLQTQWLVCHSIAVYTPVDTSKVMRVV